VSRLVLVLTLGLALALQATARGSFNVTDEHVVDSTAPDTVITSGPSGTTSISTPTFTFLGTEPASTFACRLDNAPFAPCTSPYLSAPLAEGHHTFAVRATDPSGNVDSTPATREFTVHRAPVPGRLRQQWRHEGGATIVARLELDDVPARASASVHCRGHGCPFSAKGFTRHGSIVAFTAAFHGAGLRPHTIVTITARAPNLADRIFRLTVRRAPLNPSLAQLCRAPGATKPARC
jgi:hypothetical protein